MRSFNGDQIIAEYDGTGTLISKFIYGAGIDEVVKGLSPSASEGTVPEWYYHFDGLGSVTDLTDSSGAPIESYSYDVFGNPDTTSSIGNTRMFTGRELDSETGLYYYRARYYSPKLGRFLQRDPVGYTAGINLYTYCDNDPINFNDPSGLSKEFIKGLLWGVGQTLLAIAIGGAIIYLAIQIPPIGLALTKAAPWLLGAGAFFSGTQFGLFAGGIGWDGQRLSPAQRGALLGSGLVGAVACIIGAVRLTSRAITNVDQGKATLADNTKGLPEYTIKGELDNPAIKLSPQATTDIRAETGYVNNKILRYEAGRLGIGKNPKQLHFNSWWQRIIYTISQVARLGKDWPK